MGLRLILAVLVLPGSLLAQSPTPPQPGQQPTPSTSSQQPGYTLKTEVRIVLTDVTVKDKQGNIVHGLPASAFHVTLDKDPRPLLSFEEHNFAPTAITAAPVAGDNTYSNEFLEHLPPVLNIVVLDTSNLGITDQMYLAIEFNKFVQQLPADQPLAIYGRVGEHLVLVQSYTADHTLLKAAAAKIMPHLRVAHDTATDESLLYDLAQQLTQIPGHKNVLWFSGGAPLPIGPVVGENPDSLRAVYDQLESARIALYPIDARGVIAVSVYVAMQHIQMRETAEDTGGQAFVSQNYLKDVAQTILHQDSSFYTLTFSPRDFHPDNKWHKVDITVEPSGYTLSYRRGYFADGNNLGLPTDARPDRHLTLLCPAGKTIDMPADLHSAPIVFEATILPLGTPAPPSDIPFTPLSPPRPVKKGYLPYVIHYSLPPDIFVTQNVDGREHASFDVAALSFNQSGERNGGQGSHVDMTLPQNNPHIPLRFSQQVDLKKGDDYLYIAVWDTVTGRLGTLQVPITLK